MTYSTIFATIEQELDLFSDLFDLLELQQQNILNRDGQSMDKTAGKITRLLEQAASYKNDRSAQLQQIGHSNTPEGMEKVCRSHGNPDNQEDWKELVELVEQCKALNLKNGELLNILQEHTDKQLERLSRKQPKTGYSANGQSMADREPTLRAQA